MSRITFAPAGRAGGDVQVPWRATLEGVIREYLAMLYTQMTHPELEIYLARGRLARAEAIGQAVPSLAQAGAQLFRRVRAGLARRHLRRKTQAELQALPDRILKDVGVRRGEITEIARRLAEQAIQPSAAPGAESQAPVVPAVEPETLVETAAEAIGRPALAVIQGGRVKADRGIPAEPSEERVRGCG